MQSAHVGISLSDFSALVEDPFDALDKFKVSSDNKQTLLGVRSVKQDIVEK